MPQFIMGIVLLLRSIVAYMLHLQFRRTRYTLYLEERDQPNVLEKRGVGVIPMTKGFHPTTSWNCPICFYYDDRPGSGDAWSLSMMGWLSEITGRCHALITAPSFARMQCGHLFHQKCAIKAGQYDKRCPVCRNVPYEDVPFIT